MLDETPYFLLNKGKITDLAILFEKMAKTNNINWTRDKLYSKIGIEEENLKISNSQTLEIVEKPIYNIDRFAFILNCKNRCHSIFGVFFEKDSRKHVVCFSFVMIFLYLIYDGSIIATGNIGLANMYLNGVLLCLCELLGYLIIMPFAHKTPRRCLNITITITVTVVG